MLICVKLYQNKQVESASTTSLLMNFRRNRKVLPAKLYVGSISRNGRTKGEKPHFSATFYWEETAVGDFLDEEIL